MAHFFGTVQGGRGEASRLGHKSTGLETVAASHSGAVKTTLSVRDGIDWADVVLTPWQGSGTHSTLYSGPVAGLGVAKMDGDTTIRELITYLAILWSMGVVVNWVFLRKDRERSGEPLLDWSWPNFGLHLILGIFGAVGIACLIVPVLIVLALLGKI